MLPQAIMAQDAGTDVTLGLDTGYQNAVLVEENEGEWKISSQGGDPYIASTPLSRDLTEDETTLTFEYKVSEDANVELFFSTGQGYSYAAGYSTVLGTVPATKEWTRINLDITNQRNDWKWGSAGQTLRFDAGTVAGIIFQIRDIRITSEKIDVTSGFEVKDGAVQLNSQEDFDKWVEAMNYFLTGPTLQKIDVDLNADVTVSGDKCVVPSIYGVFDGNFHKITLDLNSKPADVETGTAFTQELYGTVQNIYFDGNVEGNAKYLTTVAQDLNEGAVVKNVHSAVNIISHTNGDGTHGGIAGRCEGASTLKNVVFAGTMSSPEGITTSCGGLVGWVNAKSTFDGCLMIADMSGIQDASCNTIGRNQGQINGMNVFANVAKNETPACCTIVTPEQLESGEVCFKLNGDQREIAWFQNIGEDPLPTFDSTHKQVYCSSAIRCDGQLLEPDGATFSNSGSTTVPDHQYNDMGVCDECGQSQPNFIEVVDGYYRVDTPEKLIYAAAVATNAPSTNIKITADLDMSGYTYTPITNAYSGTFDGQHHTISNLVITGVDADGAWVNDQALIGVAGGCTIKNLTLDNSCVIEGGGYCAGFVGETSGSVTITMEGLFMHGNVISHGPNGAAIYACNMSSTATISMKNCGMSGVVTGDNEAGLISGWFGGMGSIKNTWAIGSVSGHDSDLTAVFARPGSSGADSYSNCFAVQGSARTGITILSEDAGETGELTWKLNGSSFENPTWFQNIDEGDAYPSLNSERGIVYPTVDGYATVFPEDPESFANFKKGFIDVANAYIESEDVTTYASTVLLAEYTELAAVYEEASTMDEFIVAWKAEQAKKSQVDASITAYKNYEALIMELLAELESRTDFSGEDRDFLEGEYIDGGLEPGVDERAPNGSSDYILENRLLNASEVNKEIEHAKELLRIAVANGYEPGTEITNMLVNANFADGFTGWKGTVFTGSAKDSREDSEMRAAEIWSAGAHNMYQEIVAAKAGVYELQVRGGYRPFDEQMEIQYYPYIYINGNANYLQAIIEDYIPVEEAVDGENCNLDPDQVADRPITNEVGDTIGWAIHGVQSCNVAFSVGRYDNRVLIQANEGDTLRIGINHPYSGCGSDGYEWVGIGDIHLTYHGELEASEEALDRVLESMLARANTLLTIQHKTDADYVKFPNYSQALKDRVAANIEKAANAADVATKYEVIEDLGAAFIEIVACKKAYKSYFAKIEDIYSYAYDAALLDANCGALGEQAQTIMDEGMAAYDAGTLSTEEALACEIANTIDVYPTIDENGAYHVANTAQYAAFVDMVNGGNNDVNLILDGDVYMNTGMVMTTFNGDIDGQDHTINVDIEPSADNGAMIGSLYSSHVQNLIIRGTITTSYKYAAGVAAHTYDGGTFDRVQSYVDIIGNLDGDGTHGGLVGVNESGTLYVNNSLFGGSMSGKSHSNGGIVGWSSGTSVSTGCMVIANITAPDTNANIIGRSSMSAVNCYYVTPYGGNMGGATQVTTEQLASGEVALGLNGGSTRKDVVWRQNLDGSDLYPTLDATHKIVYVAADGTYTNELQYEIQKYSGSKEDPYILSTPQDMALLRSFLIPGRVNYVKLANDIDMAEITDWYPLNMVDDKANGLSYQNIIDFDGQGHVISNFSCINPEGEYNSFFGILNGEVRNVGFKDANVVCTESGTGILAGYMGHDQYKNADATKKMSYLTNVWVTGKLNVESSYAGGLIGNVGGPTTIKNCYSNIEITSEANYIGGIVGRVRDELNINQAYAAGSINTTTSENVGGIVGGGQLVATDRGFYNNIAVWNNTDQNFGNTIAPIDVTLPTADLLDVVFNEDGTATDLSPMQMEITPMGEPKVVYNETYGKNVFMSESNVTTPVTFYKIDYSDNDAFKAALSDGYAIETIFKLHGGIGGTIKPFCATQSGGFGIEMSSDGQIKHIAHTDVDGTKAYRYANSTAYAQQDEYYHVIGVYEKDARVTIYVNGINKAEGDAPGTLNFPSAAVSQWLGLGADPNGTVSGGESGANFEIVTARIYNEPIMEEVAKSMYYQLIGKDFAAGDKVSNISYYNGSNFAELQGVVVGWGAPWQCDMSEGTYPTFDGTLADGINKVTFDTKGKIFNINGIQVEKTNKGLYIIDGKKVMVK